MTATCCDGNGQVEHGHGALSWVTLCRDRECGLRRDALFMGVDPAVLDAWWPRDAEPTSPKTSVNGSALCPKDGDSGAATQGRSPFPAPAASPSCADDPPPVAGGTLDHDPARVTYPRTRAGSGRTDRRAA